MENALDRRVVRTRKLLQDALLNLILRKGYDTIRVQEITDEANLGRATFYVHYKDKEDLLIATLNRIGQELKNTLESDTSVSPVPGFHALFTHAAKNRNYYLVIFNNVRGRHQIQNMMTDVIQPHIKQIISNSEQTDIILNILVGAVLQLLEWWLLNDMSIPLSEIEEIIWSFLSQGICRQVV